MDFFALVKDEFLIRNFCVDVGDFVVVDFYAAALDKSSRLAFAGSNARRDENIGDFNSSFAYGFFGHVLAASESAFRMFERKFGRVFIVNDSGKFVGKNFLCPIDAFVLVFHEFRYFVEVEERK